VSSALRSRFGCSSIVVRDRCGSHGNAFLVGTALFHGSVRAVADDEIELLRSPDRLPAFSSVISMVSAANEASQPTTRIVRTTRIVPSLTRWTAFAVAISVDAFALGPRHQYGTGTSNVAVITCVVAGDELML
jgi:hypothetical protein